MKSRHLRRISTRCRQVFLALLVLCLIMQPVIAGQAELHEVIRHSGALDDHAQLHATQAQPDSNDADFDAGTSHEWMHHAHCCAQPQLLSFAHMVQLPAFAHSSITRSTVSPQAVPAAYSATPFRPPIAG